MSETTTTTDAGRTVGGVFVVPGIFLTSIRKELKPALPKKRQESSYRVVITATEDKIRIAIPGAATFFPAITSGPFVAEVPYVLFKCIMEGTFDPDAPVKCELVPGCLCVNGMATSSSQIIVRPGESTPAAAASSSPATAPATSENSDPAAAPPAIPDPLDATIGLPLLIAYKYIRQYGIHQFTASKTFAAQQKEVDALLKKVERLLSPVGITRSDLERILDRKVGLA